mgnify:CR=1 FL=1
MSKCEHCGAHDHEEKEENLNSYIKTMHRWIEYDKNLEPDAIRYRYQIVIDNENQLFSFFVRT